MPVKVNGDGLAREQPRDPRLERFQRHKARHASLMLQRRSRRAAGQARAASRASTGARTPCAAARRGRGEARADKARRTRPCMLSRQLNCWAWRHDASPIARVSPAHTSHNFARHRRRVVDRPDAADLGRHAVDHRPARDPDHRQSRGLRLDHRNAERLVGHRRGVKVGARQPARQQSSRSWTIARQQRALARQPLGQRRAHRPVADQHEERAHRRRQAAGTPRPRPRGASRCRAARHR